MSSKRKLTLGACLMALTLVVGACGAGNNNNAGSSPSASPTASGAASPTASASESAAASDVKVAIVFATGGLGDKSFNDNGYAGAERAKSELGIEYDYVEPTDIAEYEGYHRDFAKDGEYDLIVGIGFDQVDAISKAADEFPDQKFLIIDSTVDKPNVASAVFKDQEGAFLAGAVSAQKSESKTIGIVGGMDIPLINAFVAGFKSGAQYIDPNVEVLVNYVGSWNDSNTAKEMAISMYDGGADIVYGAAGASGLGVYNAAKEKGKWAVGADMIPSQDPDALYLTTVKRVDNVVFNQIQAIIDGSWQAGIQSLGVKEEAVGYSVEGATIETPQEFIDKAEELKAKIASGELVVPAALEEVDPFLANNKNS